MEKIKEILLYEYIGAIAIGFMLAQAAAHVISGFMQPLIFYLERRNVEFGRFSSAHYSWDQSVPSFVSAALLVMIAFGLIRWLYFAKESTASEADHPPENP